MTEYIHVEEFIAEREQKCLVDVRSPIEYQRGHIPGAFNVPLFSNEERAIIGTAYKQESQEKAIRLGMAFAEKRKEKYLEAIHQLQAGDNLIVHCWRGGMRSRKFAEFLTENHIKSTVLKDGYKSWRREAHKEFSKERILLIIGGYTGTGKTELLHFMKEHGRQTIDLEGLADHRGSAFGLLPGHVQPTTEQFENDLYEELRKTDDKLPLFLEDESAFIGNVFAPQPFYRRMEQAPLFFLEVPKELRAQRLAKDYGDIPKDFLWNNILKIKKRFSKQKIDEVKAHLYGNQLDKTAMDCLAYYDKMYEKALAKKQREQVYMVRSEQMEISNHYAQLQKHPIFKNHVRN